MSELSILYVGSLASSSNSSRRYNSLKDICHDSEAINTDPYILNKFVIRIQFHLNIGPGIYFLNCHLKKKVKQKKYDIILVDNKSYLTSKTLLWIKKKQPNVRLANLLTDDPFGKFGRTWSLYKKAASRFDIAFVQRVANINELISIGVKNVALCYRSYDPEYNRPIPLNDTDKKQYYTRVGFVGSYEEPRASYIAFLIENGIPVTVTGAGWINQKYWEIIQPYYKAPFVYGDDYIKAICGMDVALHFLRHANRDEQDSRTFEIPATGTFMLAEKSDVHLALFEDKKEAVFFNTKEELLQKVRYYLEHPQERNNIALAGLERCKRSGYSHQERLQYVVNKIVSLP